MRPSCISITSKRCRIASESQRCSNGCGSTPLRGAHPTLYFSTVDSASHDGRLDRPAVKKAVLEVERGSRSMLNGIDALPIGEEINL